MPFKDKSARAAYQREYRRRQAAREHEEVVSPVALPPAVEEEGGALRKSFPVLRAEMALRLRERAVQAPAGEGRRASGISCLVNGRARGRRIKNKPGSPGEERARLHREIRGQEE